MWKILRPSSCCCFLSLRPGALIIGVVHILAFIVLGTTCLVFGSEELIFDLKFGHAGLLCIVLIFSNVCMIFGAQYRQHPLIAAWLWINAVLILIGFVIFGMIFTQLYFALDNSEEPQFFGWEKLFGEIPATVVLVIIILIILIVSVPEIYFLLVVNSLYMDIKEKETSRPKVNPLIAKGIIRPEHLMRNHHGSLEGEHPTQDDIPGGPMDAEHQAVYLPPRPVEIEPQIIPSNRPLESEHRTPEYSPGIQEAGFLPSIRAEHQAPVKPMSTLLCQCCAFN